MSPSIAVVSHSLIAQRQQDFFEYLGTIIPTMMIGPSQWGNMKWSHGFPVRDQGNIYDFEFDSRAVFKHLLTFKPEIIYVQEEFNSYCLNQAREWAKNLRCKLAVFVWENQRPPISSISDVDLIIAGNREAAAIHRTDTILPQVGIDPEQFLLGEQARAFDILFASAKHTREKGWDLYAKLPFSKSFSIGTLDWHKMGMYYRNAKIVVTPSRDTPAWKEQFSPFSNVEGLLSGCSVVASDSAAMVEWLDGCPGVRFFHRGEFDVLESEVRLELDGWTVNSEGRAWAEQKFGTPAVAEKLIEVLENID